MANNHEEITATREQAGEELLDNAAVDHIIAGDAGTQDSASDTRNKISLRINIRKRKREQACGLGMTGIVMLLMGCGVIWLGHGFLVKHEEAIAAGLKGGSTSSVEHVLAFLIGAICVMGGVFLLAKAAQALHRASKYNRKEEALPSGENDESIMEEDGVEVTADDIVEPDQMDRQEQNVDSGGSGDNPVQSEERRQEADRPCHSPCRCSVGRQEK